MPEQSGGRPLLGARSDRTYNVLGDNDFTGLGIASTAGRGSVSVTRPGWTAGLGVEYALIKHWTTFAEYDHIDRPPQRGPS